MNQAAYAHPSGEELLMLADGELNDRRANQIRSHVAACWECRARLHALENSISGFVDLQQETAAGLPSPDGPRALLRAQLAALAAQQPAKARHWLALASLATAALLLAVVLLRIPGHFSNVAQNEPRLIPDHRLTPGAVVALSEQEVCSSTAPMEHSVPPAMAAKIFAAYGIRHPRPRQYEVDYLIDPELGGASDPHNLWPQPYSVTWNARVKDALEDRLHGLVCSGTISLPMAQQEIATDWIAAYKKYFNAGLPLPAHFAFAKDSPWDPPLWDQ